MTVNAAIEKTEQELAEARREQRDADFAERRAKRGFADGDMQYEELRLAIRRAVLAEKRVEDLAEILRNLRSIYGA